MTSYLVDLIKKHEGLRLKPYKCTADKLTIGYGRNLDDIGISEDEAEYLLIHDITQAEQDLAKIFDTRFLYDLSDVRYAVLVDMMFNLGLARFRGFKKMIRAIKEKDFLQACEEMKDSKWYAQVKTRADELIQLFKEG